VHQGDQDKVKGLYHIRPCLFATIKTAANGKEKNIGSMYLTKVDQIMT
jgi:hypothetical protein